MAIAGKKRVIPLELRLQQAQVMKAHSLTSLRLTLVALKRCWWHTTSYLPIVGILLLAAGSLLVLRVHWLYQRALQLLARPKEVVKDIGCIR